MDVHIAEILREILTEFDVPRERTSVWLMQDWKSDVDATFLTSITVLERLLKRDLNLY